MDQVALQEREQDRDRNRAQDDAGGELAPLHLVLAENGIPAPLPLWERVDAMRSIADG